MLAHGERGNLSPGTRLRIELAEVGREDRKREM